MSAEEVRVLLQDPQDLTEAGMINLLKRLLKQKYSTEVDEQA